MKKWPGVLLFLMLGIAAVLWTSEVAADPESPVGWLKKDSLLCVSEATLEEFKRTKDPTLVEDSSCGWTEWTLKVRVLKRRSGVKVRLVNYDLEGWTQGEIK